MRRRNKRDLEVHGEVMALLADPVGVAGLQRLLAVHGDRDVRAYVDLRLNPLPPD